MALPAEEETEKPDYESEDWKKWRERGAEIVELKPLGGKAYGRAAKRLTPLERMERDEIITPQMLSGANKFHHHFRQASLERYASINLFRVMGGMGEAAAERQLFHKREVSKALKALNGGLMASVVWDVCGLEITVAEWVRKKQVAGAKIPDAYARGILIAALDVLAKHFRL